jgi:hypothetical protein
LNRIFHRIFHRCPPHPYVFNGLDASGRTRDKIAASKKKGMWMGGNVPLGYDASERTLVINPAEAETVRRHLRALS